MKEANRITPEEMGETHIMRDPHHNGAGEWTFKFDKLWYRNRTSSKWTHCKRVSVTPERINVIYKLIKLSNFYK